MKALNDSDLVAIELQLTKILGQYGTNTCAYVEMTELETVKVAYTIVLQVCGCCYAVFREIKDPQVLVLRREADVYTCSTCTAT